MVLIMAKEIKVTFDNGGIYEGFANTYTLNDSITYYFSFDLDYRVQLTNNSITLQEYRNAGAWYPIDIITGFEVSEISGGGTGDVTKKWVQDNFVKKSGDTMTGALRFNFGNGVVFKIEPNTTGTNRVKVTGNGEFGWENDNKKRTFSIISTVGAVGIDIYKVGSNHGAIWLRNNEYATTGDYRGISFYGIVNKSTNTVWVLDGKFRASNEWYFRGLTSFYKTSFWYSADGTINAEIGSNGNIRIYNNGNIALHKNGRTSETNYYTAYKYDGRDTVSNVGGLDPRYRIVGYTNFANSVESYGNITIKTENQTTGILTKLTKDGIYIENASNPNSNDRAVITYNQFIQYAGSQQRFAVNSGRIDIFNDRHIFLHSGAPGTTESFREYSYNEITGYNHAPFNIASDIRIELNAPNLYGIAPNGTNITSNNGFIILQDSKGVYGRSSNTEQNTYITNTTQNVYVQTSQTPVSDTKRDELTAILDLFQIVYNVLDKAGIAGAGAIAQYTSDVVLWIYDNQNGVLKPTITKIRNLIHS